MHNSRLRGNDKNYFVIFVMFLSASHESRITDTYNHFIGATMMVSLYLPRYLFPVVQ
jgi:hypothetical protein